MKKSIITPNYERMRECFCHALQTAWVDYCKANAAYLESMWFNEQGELCMLYTEQRKEELDKADAALTKAGKDLQDFDAWVRVEKEIGGE